MGTRAWSFAELESAFTKGIGHYGWGLGSEHNRYVWDIGNHGSLPIFKELYRMDPLKCRHCGGRQESCRGGGGMAQEFTLGDMAIWPLALGISTIFFRRHRGCEQRLRRTLHIQSCEKYPSKKLHCNVPAKVPMRIFISLSLLKDHHAH